MTTPEPADATPAFVEIDERIVSLKEILCADDRKDLRDRLVLAIDKGGRF